MVNVNTPTACKIIGNPFMNSCPMIKFSKLITWVGVLSGNGDVMETLLRNLVEALSEISRISGFSGLVAHLAFSRLYARQNQSKERRIPFP